VVVGSIVFYGWVRKGLRTLEDDGLAAPA